MKIKISLKIVCVLPLLAVLSLFAELASALVDLYFTTYSELIVVV